VKKEAKQAVKVEADLDDDAAKGAKGKKGKKGTSAIAAKILAQ
jgi:hypothetical protein